jgi:hypothetical protein
MSTPQKAVVRGLANALFKVARRSMCTRTLLCGFAFSFFLSLRSSAAFTYIFRDALKQSERAKQEEETFSEMNEEIAVH